MKQIDLTLSRSSIDDAIEEIEKYQIELIEKCKRFIYRLSEIGANAAIMAIHNGWGDAEKGATFDIEMPTVSWGVIEGSLSITSTPKVTDDGRVFYPHLAWEFGAGVYFNGKSSPNPKAGEFGMGPGTFPGQKHAMDPKGWYYKDGDHMVHSLGTQATMPMFNAGQEIIERVEEIALEVFGV